VFKTCWGLYPNKWPSTTKWWWGWCGNYGRQGKQWRMGTHHRRHDASPHPWTHCRRFSLCNHIEVGDRRVRSRVQMPALRSQIQRRANPVRSNEVGEIVLFRVNFSVVWLASERDVEGNQKIIIEELSSALPPSSSSLSFSQSPATPPLNSLDRPITLDPQGRPSPPPFF